MMKKLVVLLACLGLAFQLTSCTSKNSQADSEVAADVDSADLEKLEGDEALEIAGDNSLASDQLPEDALGETTTTIETTTTTAETYPGQDQATTEKADVATHTETLPADPFAETAELNPPAADVPSTTIVDSGTAATSDNTTMVESSTRTETSTTVVDGSETEKKPTASLQKVATAPWKVGKNWVNTVYFARPGDSLSSISQMVYGADKTKELKKANPTLASRGVRPGDKVYYSSPHRPDDSSGMITYYEDNGMAPEVYVAKSGDNIRKISKDLLGYDNAWKEVWSSNAVDSKGAIAEGTELRYWRGGAVAAAPAAPQAPVHQEVTGSMPQAPEMQVPSHEEQYPQQAQGEIPPPPMPEQQPMEMAPPPPPPQDIAQEYMAPPPPPPVEAVNPPPPPAPHAGHAAAEEAPTGMDNDTTMALAVVGLAAAGLAVLIVLRKKRKQKELEQQAMDNTHVGT